VKREYPRGGRAFVCKLPGGSSLLDAPGVQARCR
jgi:hypothetical protein